MPFAGTVCPGRRSAGIFYRLTKKIEMTRFGTPTGQAGSADGRQWAYVKTEAGRLALADRRSGLAIRDRQIMLLCNGTQTVAGLADLFGPEVGGDLSRLRDRGLIEPQSAQLTETLRTLAQESVAQVDVPASSSELAEAEAAKRHERQLLAARQRASRLAGQFGSPAAERLLQGYHDSQLEADVLVYVSRVIGLIEHEQGIEMATFEAEKLALMLPRSSVSLLLDCLLDEVKPELVAQLYERLLADTEFGDESDSST